MVAVVAGEDHHRVALQARPSQRVEHNADLPVDVGHEVAVEAAVEAPLLLAPGPRAAPEAAVQAYLRGRLIAQRAIAEAADPARLGAGRREVLGQRRTLFQRCRLEGGAVGVAGQHPADVVRIDERGPQEERPPCARRLAAPCQKEIAAAQRQLLPRVAGQAVKAEPLFHLGA